jgi:hypothetical protein
MTNLVQASRELFSRAPDERFESLADLSDYCQQQRRDASERWHPPLDISPQAACVGENGLGLTLGSDGAFLLNDWSFGQLCRLAGVQKGTVNRLTAETASRVLKETLPGGTKPLQVLTQGDQVRAVHAASYTRLYNAELLEVIEEFGSEFSPPPVGFNGATGLYAGEQDVFCFLVDPDGWTNIRGEVFAPGFFAYNSEVGRRSVGITTFWYQRVCGNHIVWDATDVCQFSRKHTANVRDALVEIRRMIEQLIAKRDERTDAFVALIDRAMDTKLGSDAEEVEQALRQRGIPATLAKQTLESVPPWEDFTVFSAVDALTRLARNERNAGARVVADQKAATLLALAG